MGIAEKIVYSRKTLWLILLLITIDAAYIVHGFTRETVVYGTAAMLILLGYVAYYSLGHRTVREGASYTVLASTALITGLIIGLVTKTGPGLAETLYTLSLTAALLIINYTLAKHVA